MRKVRLLPGEKQELRLRPHPLSFLGKYLVAAWPAIWGLVVFLVVRTDWWKGAESGKWYQVWTFLYGNAPSAYVLLLLGLAVAGAVVAVSAIKWKVFFAYVGAGILAIVLGALWKSAPYTWDAPAILWVASFPAVWGVEQYRRSHDYVLTNLRILFRGGFLVQRERQLRYESITDLDGSQGPLGSLFGYGTLIPVTQSGFGLGADTSQAMVGMGVGGQGKAGPGMGVGAGIGVAAGGGKEVQVGRARSYHQLTGVRPYGDVKYLLETLIQNATATPYLRQQVELQQQMVEALGRMGQAPMSTSGVPPVFEGDRVE